jgi:hypothetical protein
VPEVPAAPIAEVLEPGVVAVVPALPKVLGSEPEPARSSAPLPVELEDPSVVPVPLVPDEPMLPALPRAVVVPGVVSSVVPAPAAPSVLVQGRAERAPAADPGVVPSVEPGVVPRVDPGVVPSVDPGVDPMVEPEVVWASATPPAAANADAVTSMANVFLLAFMFRLLDAVERTAGCLRPLMSH